MDEEQIKKIVLNDKEEVESLVKEAKAYLDECQIVAKSTGLKYIAAMTDIVQGINDDAKDSVGLTEEIVDVTTKYIAEINEQSENIDGLGGL